MFLFDLFIIYIASILTFALFGWDKHLAIYQKRRIPEFVLLLFSFLCGAFGALCAMIFFRHKTHNRKFIISIPLLLILQLIIDITYRVFIQ